MVEIPTLTDIMRKIDSLWSWKYRLGNYISKKFRYIDSNIREVAKDVHDLKETSLNVQDIILGEIKSASKAILSTVNNTLVKPLSYYVDTLQMDVRDWIGDIRSDLSEIRNDLNTVFDFINHIDGIIDARIEAFKDKIMGWIEDKFISIVEHVLEQEVKQ